MTAAGPQRPADPAGHSVVSPVHASFGGPSAVVAGAGTITVWRSRAKCGQALLAGLGTWGMVENGIAVQDACRRANAQVGMTMFHQGKALAAAQPGTHGLDYGWW